MIFYSLDERNTNIFVNILIIRDIVVKLIIYKC